MRTPVVHPPHYNQARVRCKHCARPVECIDVAEQFNFNIGNSIKYEWRAGDKDPATHIQDLEKAREYLWFEIQRLRALKPKRRARKK